MTIKSALYAALRLSNDLNAIAHGPAAVVRRVERKLLWRLAARLIGRATR